MNPFSSNFVKWAVLGTVVGLAIFFLARPYLTGSSEVEWEQTVAVYPSPAAPQAYVHGWSKTSLGACQFSLLWKAGDDQWLVYDLDQNGAQWDRYSFQEVGGELLISANGKGVAVYDPKKGEFTNVRTKHTEQTPKAVIHGANLEHEAQWQPYHGG
ncbi:MAG TPA: hypothetical protein VHC95_12505 [Opitutales bacterium]|nr:hypothetical protein [Opitutales bacterium]